MQLQIPELSVVVMIGASGSGKSSFVREHFGAFEVLSSDYCRGLVGNDENNQEATKDAFAVLHDVLRLRLARGLLTVIDATNVQPEARRPLVEIAREFHCVPVAIVLDVPPGTCHERNQSRPDRAFGPHVVRNQTSQLRRSMRGLVREGFRYRYILKPDEIQSAEIVRQPTWTNRRDVEGPFDIVGDVHGCCDEFELLLEELGYRVVTTLPDGPMAGTPVYEHPEGRRLISLGDLVDRGPRAVDALKLVYAMCAHGSALCVPGNHEAKLLRKLAGRNVQDRHGFSATWEQFEALEGGPTGEIASELRRWMDGLVSHYVLDHGRLVVAHAGMKEEMQGRASGKVRSFALFGETTGEIDEFGLPVRYPWANDYRGKAAVVYGHTPVPHAEWLNNTICLDTGCVFGGKLTALRWPERELVEVKANQMYAEPVRPPEFGDARSAQQSQDDVLLLDELRGKLHVTTQLAGTVTVREENGAAALEVMSRFAVDPHWLIYLPPTMSPCATSVEAGFLEHPAEAFEYYRKQNVQHVICEQKHMGSRAIVVVCRDPEVAVSRFGVLGPAPGSIYTRTGRPFFSDIEVERHLLERVREACEQSGLFDELNTNWLCLDCELMPWSDKAIELLRRQYAAVGSAGTAAMAATVAVLRQAADRATAGETADLLRAMLQQSEQRQSNVHGFVEAYRQYCWDVNSMDDYKLAPFHVLAGEGQVFTSRPHDWHMQQCTRLAEHSRGLCINTHAEFVDLDSPEQTLKATEWWLEYTASGGEGMVVKPREFTLHHRGRLVQPGVKCRGKEYLRIIYGPDYDIPEHLQRLRQRGLARKRSLATREYALGVEALARFINREPLRRVHECVFGVLALESEPVDPRL